MCVKVNLESLCPEVFSPHMTRFYSFAQHILIKLLLCSRPLILRSCFKAIHVGTRQQNQSKSPHSTSFTLSLSVYVSFNISFCCKLLRKCFSRNGDNLHPNSGCGWTESPRGVRVWFAAQLLTWQCGYKSLDMLLKCKLGKSRSAVRPETLHFSYAPSRCWCCWSIYFGKQGFRDKIPVWALVFLCHSLARDAGHIAYLL